MNIKEIVEGMTAPQVAQVIKDNFNEVDKDKANKTDLNKSISDLSSVVEANKTDLTKKIDNNKDEADAKLSELGSEVQDNRLFVGNNTKSFEWNEVGANWKSDIFLCSIKTGEKYTLKYRTSENDRNGVFFFTSDKNKNAIQYILTPSNRAYGNLEFTFTANEDADGVVIQTDITTNSSVFTLEILYASNIAQAVKDMEKDLSHIEDNVMDNNAVLIDASYKMMPSGYINHSTGMYEPIAGYCATDFIPLIESFKYLYSGVAEYAVANYAFYDKDKKFISAVPKNDGNTLEGYILSDIPLNAKYIRFSGVESSFNLRIIPPYDNSYGFNPSPGYVNYHNGIFEELVSDRYCATEFILLDNTKRYIYSGQAEYGGANYAFYDKDKKFIRAIPTSDGSTLNEHEVKNIPSNAKYIRFSGISTTFSLKIESKEYYPDYSALSKLTNKTILYNGDSLCESRIDKTKKEYNGGAYAKLISDRVKCIYNNRGRSGALLSSGTAPSGYNPERHIVNDVDKMQQECDLICFEGGVNDWSANVPIGEVSSYFSRDFDESTVIGALEGILYQAKVKWLGKPIVFIISHQCREASWKKNTAEVPYTFAELRDKMIEVCNKWSVPYFDAFAKSGLNGNLEEYGKYLNSNPTGVVDGWHPNKEAYEKFYVPQLISLFESLIIE